MFSLPLLLLAVVNVKTEPPQFHSSFIKSHYYAISVAVIVPLSSTVILKFLLEPSVEDFRIISVVLIPHAPLIAILFAVVLKVTLGGSPSTDNTV